jgi:large subunit ribosomal protein L17
MRHRVAGRILGRTSAHRRALRRNLVSSLFEHETISTTIEKAKEVKPFAEKLITLAKKGTLAARRRAIALLGNRRITAEEDDKIVKKGTIIGKLFSEIAPRYLDRAGGYTRIIRLSLRRLGDSGRVVLLQLVGNEEAAQKKTKTSARKKTPKKTKKATKKSQTTKTKQPTNSRAKPKKEDKAEKQQ